MFDRNDHTHEILRKLDELLERQDLFRSDQLHLTHIAKLIMATLQEVQASQVAEAQANAVLAQAVTDLGTRIANLPQEAATASDLDTLVSASQSIASGTNANIAAINALAPTP